MERARLDTQLACSSHLIIHQRNKGTDYEEGQGLPRHCWQIVAQCLAGTGSRDIVASASISAAASTCQSSLRSAMPQDSARALNAAQTSSWMALNRGFGHTALRAVNYALTLSANEHSRNHPMRHTVSLAGHVPGRISSCEMLAPYHMPISLARSTTSTTYSATLCRFQSRVISQPSRHSACRTDSSLSSPLMKSMHDARPPSPLRSSGYVEPRSRCNARGSA